MNGGPRGSTDDLWIAVAVVVAPLLAWWAWSDRIVAWAFHLKLAELRGLHALGFGAAASAELAAALRGALTAPDQIDFDTFLFGLEAVGIYLRGPVAALLAGLGAWLLLCHPAGRFRRRFDLAGLAEAMREPWPYALHALRRGNRDLPLDHPVWGMALSPAEFLRRHDLVDDLVDDLADDLAERADGGGGRLREARAEAALAAQLGAPWAEAPPHARALAGVFALRIAAAEAETDAAAEPPTRRAAEALRRLALAAAANATGDRLPPAARYAEIVAETAAVLGSEPIRRRLAGHAYTSTALLRLLEDARQGGVLPAALFSWLKGVDRPLWYALSSLGRRVPFVEALGATSHFEAERRAGRALYPPAVEAAVEGLRREAARMPPAGDGPT
jgi:intracellular multiplication protein IcmP